MERTEGDLPVGEHEAVTVEPLGVTGIRVEEPSMPL